MSKRRYTHVSLQEEIELYNDYAKDAGIPIEFVLIRNTTNIIGWRQLHKNYTGYIGITSGTPRECADGMRQCYGNFYREFTHRPLTIEGKLHTMNGIGNLHCVISADFVSASIGDKDITFTESLSVEETLRRLCDKDTLFIDYTIAHVFDYRFRNEKFDFQTFVETCAVWMIENANPQLSFNENLSRLQSYLKM